MELTVLGNYGPFPPKRGACSCYLLTLSDGENVVLDMGPGTLSRLQEHISLTEIRAIMLTHLHFDHISDLFALKYAIALLRKRGVITTRIPLYLPETPKEVAALVADSDLFNVFYMRPDTKVLLCGAVFTFYGMQHPVETYAIGVEEGSKKLVYTGDTRYHEGLFGLAEGVDLFLVDAGLLKRDLLGVPAHLSVEQACQVGQGAKRTVLTHLLPLYSQEELEAEVRGQAEFSEYGKRYSV